MSYSTSTLNSTSIISGTAAGAMEGISPDGIPYVVQDELLGYYESPYWGAFFSFLFLSSSLIIYSV
jgi:hypothetical protein